MVKKIFTGFGFGVILLSSIPAPAAEAGAGATLPTTSVYFSLAGGTYNTPQLLTLTDSTPAAVIYYSTTGQPTLSSPTYRSPIVIKSTETVTAVAIAPGYAWSAESAKSYDVSNVSAKQYVVPGVGGDSLLGLLEGAISFCGTISAGSPAGYRQMDLLYTSGQTSRDLQKVRGSDDYKSAYNQTQQQLQGLSKPNAVSVCNSN
jgi:hypothetical protein